MSDRASATLSNSTARGSGRSANRSLNSTSSPCSCWRQASPARSWSAAGCPRTPSTPACFWTGPLLVVGFLLAEQLAINVDVRSGVAWTISFTEIPLVLGLLVAPFEVVLAAHVVAGVGRCSAAAS